LIRSASWEYAAELAVECFLLREADAPSFVLAPQVWQRARPYASACRRRLLGVQPRPLFREQRVLADEVEMLGLIHGHVAAHDVTASNDILATAKVSKINCGGTFF